jgi:hypothetical protein
VHCVQMDSSNSCKHVHCTVQMYIYKHVYCAQIDSRKHVRFRFRPTPTSCKSTTPRSSRWQGIWDNLAVHLGQPGRAFGTAWPYIWDSLAVHLGQPGRAFGTTWPYIWDNLSVHLGQPGRAFPEFVKFRHRTVRAWRTAETDLKVGIIIIIIIINRRVWYIKKYYIQSVGFG